MNLKIQMINPYLHKKILYMKSNLRKLYKNKSLWLVNTIRVKMIVLIVEIKDAFSIIKSFNICVMRWIIYQIKWKIFIWN